MVEAMAEPVATTGARTSSPGKGPAEMKSRPSSKHMSRPSSNGSVKRASGLRESVNGTPSRRPSTLGKGRPSSREKGSKGATRASQENGVSLDSLVEKPKPVAGLESLFLTGTTLKIIGLEEELGTDALKELPLKVLLDDIQFRGAISDFHPIREKLKAYVGESVLLRYNGDDRYGDGNNFEVCTTAETKAALENEVAEKLAAAAATEAARLEEEKASKTKKKKKVQSKPWTSLGSEQDIAEELVQPTRDQIEMLISRKRREFGRPARLSDKDAHELWNSSHMECRPYKDATFTKRRMEHDKGTQAIPAVSETAAQTNRVRLQNRAVQYAPHDLDAVAKQRLAGSGAMRDFLGAVTPRYELALQQNEVLDIFEDEFANLADDEGGAGSSKSNSAITEYQSFTDLVYNKGRVVSAIDWLPNRKGIVAVAAAEPATFAERVETSGRVHTSAVLVWNFTDPIHPQFVLESPSDVLTFRFNPSKPDLIAGGCYNGQVVLWDTASIQEQVFRKEKRGGDDEERAERDGSHVPVVKHSMLSSLEGTHALPVADLHWLPGHTEVDSRGKVSANKAGETNVFGTIAPDGRLLFWDVRIKPDRRSTPPKPTGTAPRGAAAPAVEEWTWSPVFEIRMNRVEGSGQLGGVRVELSRLASGSTQFVCGAEDGQVVFADLTPLVPPEHGEAPNYVRASADAHCGHVRALQRSPAFDDVIMTVGDWTFKLWREGSARPIFESKCADAYITCALWSPSRPAVIYLGLQDGSIQVWDFLDRSNEPFMVVPASASPVTCLEFWNQASPQLMGVGDAQGILHIMEIPRSLRRPLHKEKQSMRNFLDRESARVEYISKREKDRTAEVKQRQAQIEAAELKEKESASVAPEPISADKGPTAAQKQESEYQHLEKQFRAKLVPQAAAKPGMMSRAPSSRHMNVKGVS